MSNICNITVEIKENRHLSACARSLPGGLPAPDPVLSQKYFKFPEPLRTAPPRTKIGHFHWKYVYSESNNDRDCSHGWILGVGGKILDLTKDTACLRVHVKPSGQLRGGKTFADGKKMPRKNALCVITSSIFELQTSRQAQIDQ